MANIEVTKWINNVESEEMRREILSYSSSELADAFDGDLKFGTAGMRGVMGMGSNRINVYTVRKVSKALGTYMLKNGKRRAVICYDSRKNSKVFAQEAARAMLSLGVKVILSDEVSPVPFLAYLAKNYADAGVMITASHNPKEYNGYKVYDENGCQIDEAQAAEIFSIAKTIDPFCKCFDSMESYLSKGLLSYVDHHMYEQYIKAAISVFDGKKADITAIYTPLCGAGYKIVPVVLKSLGCQADIVLSQSQPDSDFPGCNPPNPEKLSALSDGILFLKESDSTVLLANDPDADRLGVAEKDGDEVYKFSGNEIGLIMAEYLLRNYVGKEYVVIRSLVSTDLVDAIADRYGARTIVTPTGFKYIGEIIGRLKEAGEEDRFLFGFEESCGYLVGPHIRDKDGVQAAALIAVIAAECKAEGITLKRRLQNIYDAYGRRYNMQFSFAMSNAKKSEVMSLFRKSSLNQIEDSEVISRTDHSTDADMPTDMIEYVIKEGRVIIRPSGTEPLIKIYTSLSNCEFGEKVKSYFSKIIL